VNGALTDAIRDLDGVYNRDLAAVRRADGFDAAEEQRLLVEHDTAVFQFPWYWYSIPGILKEWMDQVLPYGFAYGAGGTKLHGRPCRS
jgi:glutathione-regulated potassium-efflux system ancillary protein KefG